MRIGLVGIDSSHAERYLDLLNLRNRHPGIRATGLWGADPDRSQDLAARFSVPLVADAPLDLLGRVDAVLVGDRHGDAHRDHAAPFLSAGVPVFLDKPLAGCIDDAVEILAAAESTHTAVSSASALRWQPDTLALANAAAELGGPRIVTATGPFDPDSSYGGAAFYGSHAIELAFELAGTPMTAFDARWCGPDAAVVSGTAGNVCAIALLQRPAGGATIPFQAQLVCPGGTLSRTVALGADYLAPVLDRMITMVRTGEPPLTTVELLAPVRAIAALPTARPQPPAESH